MNADDFGLSAGVTSGILEAHAAGSVTSTSMMVQLAGWDDAVRQARATPSLGVGLHFNLLVGNPLTEAPSLRDHRTGRFPPFAAFVRRVLSGRVDVTEVEAECEAQLQALRTSGLRVTHIDSHRHTHAMPGVRRGVAEVAARHGLPLRQPVETRRRAIFLDDFRSLGHRALLRASWRLASPRAAITRTTDHFAGVALQGGRHVGARLVALLDRLREGSTELMVHPGHADQALCELDGYTWQRERELAALTSAAVRERLRDPAFSLVTFAEL